MQCQAGVKGLLAEVRLAAQACGSSAARIK